MADILQFKQRESAHSRGWASCQHCRHKWQAVAPAGVVELECPKCHSMKGLYIYGHEDDESTWLCKCGCHVFTISETGAVCWKCGVKQEF